MRIAVAIIVTLLVAATVGAQDARRINVGRLGPQVGQVVPDFNLPDQHGEIRSLTSLLGPKGAVLVFFRSADW